MRFFIFHKYHKFLPVLLIFVCMLFSSVQAKVLEGQVSYTEEDARRITFENVQKTIPEAEFAEFMYDKDYKQNKQLMKQGKEAKDRFLEVFSKGKLKLAYSVTYKDNLYRTYYYTKLGGYLAFFDVIIECWGENDVSQIKVYRYNFKGELVAAGLFVSDYEGYLYDKNEKLIVHRVGNFGYNSKGRKLWSAEDLAF